MLKKDSTDPVAIFKLKVLIESRKKLEKKQKSERKEKLSKHYL